MQARLSYGRISFSEPGELYGQAEPVELGSVGLSEPVDDLLGLRLDDPPYVASLAVRYSAVLPRGWGSVQKHGAAVHERVRARLRSQLAGWEAAGVPALLLRAARRAERGNIVADLGPILERVTYRPGDEPDELADGDLPALAAWALVEMLRREPVRVRRCGLCRKPFLAPSEDALYCARPAPGRSRYCRSAKRDERFAKEHPEYRRYYKRLHERKRRGSLDPWIWELWTADNRPGEKNVTWRQIEEWASLGATASAQEAAGLLAEQERRGDNKEGV